MSQPDDFDRSLARWFEAEARPAATADVLDRALRATRRRRPRPRLYAALGSQWIGDGAADSGEAMLWRTGVRISMALLLLLLVLVLVAGAVLVGARLLQPAREELGIFAPVAGRLVYGDERGIWGVDPAAPADPATSVQLTSEAGIPLGWSSDGTRLLIMRGSGPDEHLLVLHADGSEIQVTEGPWSIAGATISPDGSRVVFAGATSDGGSALYAVDARGGSAEVLVTDADSGGWAPAYAPDGTRIAYINGGGDHSNSVWLMNPDGSDAHPIVRNESDRWPGHVSGLTWSAAGDRIALGLGGRIYTFATNGSKFTQIAGGDTTCVSAETCAINLPKSAESPYWSPDGSQIAYTTGCLGGAGAANRDGCHLAIADADGSNVRTYGFPTSGPWHPAPLASDGPSPAPTADPTPNLTKTFVSPRNGFSIRHPDRVALTPAKQLWGFSEQVDDGFDVVETGLAAVFRGASAGIPYDFIAYADISIDEWVDDQISGEDHIAGEPYQSPGGCGVPRGQQAEITIDGQSARISECPNEIEATVVFGGRVYYFTLSHDRGDARAVFDAFAATIDLTPETAVDFPDLTTTFVSPTNGFSFKYFDRGEGTLTPAKGLWDPVSGAPQNDDGFDFVETGLAAFFKGASTEIPDGVSLDAWVDGVIADLPGGCGVPRGQQAEITVDRQSGRISQCPNGIEATVVAGGRLYLFIQLSDRSDARAFFDAWVATIDLRPEDAAVPSSTPSS